MKTTDFLIIGAGIIGLTVARELQRRYPTATVTVLEKETGAGQHASGRNSGVLHSGIYYTANTMKARFTRDGNRAWQAYCDERKLAIDRCGKLVVARDENDWPGLKTLEERGRANGVEVIRLDVKQAQEIEPRVRTCQHALFIPSTATVDPNQLVAAQAADFKAAGGEFQPTCSYQTRRTGNTVATKQGDIAAGYIVNCAGLQADQVAHDFGFGQRYSITPFKGLYLYASSRENVLRTHIYPVPDLRNPFLGVHFTRTVDGQTKIGPTAIPAFWREQYGGLQGFNWRESAQIIGQMLRMALSNRNGFRRLAWQEMGKQSIARMVHEAGRLCNDVAGMDFNKWGKPGIRAQLLDRREGALVMDFVIEGDADSLHVLNAVSPAFTCAIPFATHVVDEITRLGKRLPVNQKENQEAR